MRAVGRTTMVRIAYAALAGVLVVWSVMAQQPAPSGKPLEIKVSAAQPPSLPVSITLEKRVAACDPTADRLLPRRRRQHRCGPAGRRHRGHYHDRRRGRHRRPLPPRQRGHGFRLDAGLRGGLREERRQGRQADARGAGHRAVAQPSGRRRRGVDARRGPRRQRRRRGHRLGHAGPLGCRRREPVDQRPRRARVRHHRRGQVQPVPNRPLPCSTPQVGGAVQGGICGVRARSGPRPALDQLLGTVPRRCEEGLRVPGNGEGRTRHRSRPAARTEEAGDHPDRAAQGR